MRTLKTAAAVFVFSVVLLGTLALAVPTPALADPPVSDPNCKHACPAKIHRNGYTCTFVGCSLDGLCGYAC